MLGQPLHPGLEHVSNYPHSISRCCQYQMRVDNLMELPQSKRPPRSIWGDDKQLQEYLDRVSDPKKDTKFQFTISEDDIE